MKRLLITLLVFFLCPLIFVNCSLFSLDDKKVNVDDLDKDSLSEVVEVEQEDGQDSFDVEADSLQEDLDAKPGGEPGMEEEAEKISEEKTSSEEKLAEEDQSEGEPDEEDFDDEFGSGDEENTGEISESDNDQVDQKLVRDELEQNSENINGEENGDLALESELQASEVDSNEESTTQTDGFDEVAESSNQGESFEKEDDQPSFSNKVVNLEYKSFDNGGTVVIKTATPASYQLLKDPDKNQVVIEIDEVDLPEKFKRPYITKDFKQDIAAINAYTDGTGSARFVIQTKRPIDPVVEQEGSSILIMTKNVHSEEFDQNIENTIAEERGFQDSDPQMKTSVSKDNQALNKAFGQSDQSDVSLDTETFTGEEINLEFADTDVRTIIELIADRYGINLIMDDDVSGNVNIRLRSVPWDQALLVILRSKGLGYAKQGNILRIAKQTTLSKEAKELSQQIKSEKEAKLLSGGMKVKYIPISYAKVTDLSVKLKDFISKDGKIASDERTSSLVITDYNEYIGRVIELVKALDTPPMQVEISAKLVEARDEFIRDAGINWTLGGQPFDFGSQTGQLGTQLGGGVTTTALSFDLSVGTFDIFGDLGATLGLYESQDKVKVLSQPRVVTMNKVKATIQQTTQIPVRQTVIQPNTPPVVTFNFVDLTILLDVTPQITFSGDVILDVQLKREFPGVANPDGQRELNRRSAKTTVMVKNGSTAVIGGVYQLDNVDGNKGIPFLKDIPFIGRLFKQTSKQRTKNELLLFLKPKVLKYRLGGSMISKSNEQILFDEDSNELNTESYKDNESSINENSESFDSEQEESIENDIQDELVF